MMLVSFGGAFTTTNVTRRADAAPPNPSPSCSAKGRCTAVSRPATLDVVCKFVLDAAGQVDAGVHTLTGISSNVRRNRGGRGFPLDNTWSLAQPAPSAQADLRYMIDEKHCSALEEQRPQQQRESRMLQHLAALLIPLALLTFLVHEHGPLLPTRTTGLHPHTSPAAAKLDFSWLAPRRQCPALQPIRSNEFTARRDTLAELLKGVKGDSWGAYITEPGAFIVCCPSGSPHPPLLHRRTAFLGLGLTQYRLQDPTRCTTPISRSQIGEHPLGLASPPTPKLTPPLRRYLSERPWLLVATPSTTASSHHLSVLTPAFEVSRSQRLPFALTEEEFGSVSWVAWQEAEDPYVILIKHLEQLREQDGIKGRYKVHLEENVRQFVAAGLERAAQGQEGVEVGLASIEVRQQRMRKTKAELEIQHCVAQVSRGLPRFGVCLPS